MIPYKEIKKIVRFKLGDFNETNFSDYEIKMAVNEVLRYLSVSQALKNSDFLNKGFSFDSEKDEINYQSVGIKLPRDFVSLVAVRDYKGRMLEPCTASELPSRNQYKISSDRLYTGAKSFIMMYNAMLTPVENEEDGIDLPYVFTDTLVQLTSLVLQQTDGDVMHTAADAALDELIPKRKYSNVRIKMPFRI